MVMGADEVALVPAGWLHQPHSLDIRQAVQLSFLASRQWGPSRRRPCTPSPACTARNRRPTKRRCVQARYRSR